MFGLTCLVWHYICLKMFTLVLYLKSALDGFLALYIYFSVWFFIVHHFPPFFHPCFVSVFQLVWFHLEPTPTGLGLKGSCGGHYRCARDGDQTPPGFGSTLELYQSASEIFGIIYNHVCVL
jgi:hypothetical protein